MIVPKAKVTFNKFHNKWEVYVHRKGKQHVGYYNFRTTAEGVQRAINRVAHLL